MHWPIDHCMFLFLEFESEWLNRSLWALATAKRKSARLFTLLVRKKGKLVPNLAIFFAIAPGVTQSLFEELLIKRTLRMSCQS